MLINNPYIAGNSIKSAQMFYGRNTEMQTIAQNINANSSVILIIGGRRVGKTSILQQINNGKFKDNAETVWCDCHKLFVNVYNDYDFIYELGKAILSNPIFQFFTQDFINGLTPQTASHCLQKLLKHCTEAIAPKKLLFLCDEFDSLENLFAKQILSKQALEWLATAFTLPLCFIMTCPSHYQNQLIKEAFGDHVPTVTVAEFNQEDSFALIQQPCAELNYSAEVLESLYRLSGGFPYYIQTLCGQLINHININLQPVLRPVNIVADDLGDVVEFISINTPGHIIETLKFLKELPNAMPAIAALAHTIKEADEYVDVKTILITAHEKKFKTNGINSLIQQLDQVNETSRLLEVKENRYRFRVDLLRQVICYKFQTGYAIEGTVGNVLSKSTIFEKIKALLTNGFNHLKTILFNH